MGKKQSPEDEQSPEDARSPEDESSKIVHGPPINIGNTKSETSMTIMGLKITWEIPTIGVLILVLIALLVFSMTPVFGPPITSQMKGDPFNPSPSSRPTIFFTATNNESGLETTIGCTRESKHIAMGDDAYFCEVEIPNSIESDEYNCTKIKSNWMGAQENDETRKYGKEEWDLRNASNTSETCVLRVSAPNSPGNYHLSVTIPIRESNGEAELTRLKGMSEESVKIYRQNYHLEYQWKKLIYPFEALVTVGVAIGTLQSIIMLKNRHDKK